MYMQAPIPSWLRSFRLPIAAISIAGIVVSLTLGSPAMAAPHSAEHPALALNGPILPTNGAWLGALASGDGDHTEAVAAFEELVGRKIAIDHHYIQWLEEFPTQGDLDSRDQGRIILLSWGVLDADGNCVGWDRIASGAEDAAIDERAGGLKAFAAPMFLVFHHEPESEVGVCGTTTDYINAWRHVHDRLIQDGVTNVSFVFVLMAFTYRLGDPDLYYPGDSYVDLVGADGYNWYSCPGRTDPWNEFDWVFEDFHAFGITHGKPELIAEWASMEDPDDPNHKGEWISNAAATMKTWPEIKAAVWYNGGPPANLCTWWVDTSPASLAAWQSMGADSYFNPPPPLVTVTSGPDPLETSTSATFTFQSNMQASTFTCKIDTGTANSCVSPWTVTGVPQGDRVATITATDPSSEQSNYATYSWTVDSVPPTPSINNGPSSPTNSTSATFKFNSDEPASTFTCQLDAGSYVDCDSPLTYDGLAEGSHTFNVKATDEAGNTSAAVPWPWTVDTVPPVATITSSPPVVTKDKSATFNFTSNESNSTFKCSKDGGSYWSCTSPKTYSSMSEGAHTFAVQATDPAGNVGSSASYSWTVDTTKPKVTITSGPDSQTQSTSASFAFTVTDDTQTTATCQMDSGPAVSCTGGTGSTASDAFTRTVSNGWGAATQGGTWVVTGGSTSDYAVNGSTGTMNLTSANVARLAYLPSNWGDTDFLFRISYDRKPVGSMRVIGYGVARYDVSTGSFYALRASLVWDGTMRLDATKKPALGPEVVVGAESNLGAIGAANTWYWVRGHVGAEGGSVRIQGRLWTDGTPEPSTWQYSYLDSSGPITVPGKPGLRAASWALDTPYVVSFDDYSASTGLTYSGLLEGLHTETITATDQAGNVGTATWPWTVDVTAPVATITSGPASPTKSTSATFKFNSSEGGSAFTCQLDNGAPATCTTGKLYTGLSNGSHTFILIATDQAGNISTPATWTWTVDTVAPVATITGSPPPITKDHAATFTFTSNEPGSTFKCSKDGGTYLTCTSPKVYSWIADGVHTFAVQATDTAGNLSAAASYAWTIDSTKPTVTITSGPSDPSFSSTATFAFTSNESIVTFTCQLDSNAAAACTSPKTYTGISAGLHTFKLYATDQAGNQSSTATWIWTKA